MRKKRRRPQSAMVVVVVAVEVWPVVSGDVGSAGEFAGWEEEVLRRVA